MDSHNPYQSPQEYGNRVRPFVNPIWYGPLLSLGALCIVSALLAFAAPMEWSLAFSLASFVSAAGVTFIAISFSLYRRSRYGRKGIRNRTLEQMVAPNRTWFRISIVFGASSFVAILVAKHMAGKGAELLAKSAPARVDGVSASYMAYIQAAASRYAFWSDTFHTIGLLCSVMMVAVWMISTAKHESPNHFLLTTLCGMLALFYLLHV